MRIFGPVVLVNMDNCHVMNLQKNKLGCSLVNKSVDLQRNERKSIFVTNVRLCR